MARKRPTAAQQRYLALGLDQPGGKLPLFDRDGQRIPARTIRACLAEGWCVPWVHNPVKPDWLVCRLTAEGRRIAQRQTAKRDHETGRGQA
ncbi:hypothetical protein [Yunchengibacter salinarum]|uniref:hypothetical protein n=1 Tax=Yunchengibacter salinarum TaxID=3133399 RepID=UPI0035B668BD